MKALTRTVTQKLVRRIRIYSTYKTPVTYETFRGHDETRMISKNWEVLVNECAEDKKPKTLLQRQKISTNIAQALSYTALVGSVQIGDQEWVNDDVPSIDFSQLGEYIYVTRPT